MTTGVTVGDREWAYIIWAQIALFVLYVSYQTVKLLVF
jgi:hypothetical protein